MADGRLRGIAIAAALGAAAALLWILYSFLEARAYNRVTHSDVTTWDAMWIDLRVQAEPQPRRPIFQVPSEE